MHGSKAKVQNQSLCHITLYRPRPHSALILFCGSPNLNIHTEVAKDAAVESITIQPWHKSAPWLISAATILGLIIIFQR